MCLECRLSAAYADNADLNSQETRITLISCEFTRSAPPGLRSWLNQVVKAGQSSLLTVFQFIQTVLKLTAHNQDNQQARPTEAAASTTSSTGRLVCAGRGRGGHRDRRGI